MSSVAGMNLHHCVVLSKRERERETDVHAHTPIWKDMVDVCPLLKKAVATASPCVLLFSETNYIPVLYDLPILYLHNSATLGSGPVPEEVLFRINTIWVR
jgi:hypothetical protein